MYLCQVSHWFVKMIRDLAMSPIVPSSCRSPVSTEWAQKPGIKQAPELHY